MMADNERDKEVQMAWLILVVVVVAIILFWVLWKSKKTEDMRSPVSFEATQREQLVSETEAVKSEALQTVTVEKDDLTVIEGIGPKIADVLRQAGILSFRQLSQEDPAHLRQILEDAGLRLSDPTTWPRQAALAASGDWDALKALQESLRGGREA